MSAEELYKDAFYQAYERLSKEDLFDWIMEDRIAYHKSKVDAISDEMIDEFFNVSLYDQNQQSWLISGAKSFFWHIKSKLKE